MTDELSFKSLAEGLRDTSNALPFGIKLPLYGALFGGLGSAVYMSSNRGEGVSQNTTYYTLGEGGLEKVIDTSENVLMSLYSADVGNFTALGVTHDLMGAGIALIAGMGNVKHKLLALGTAFSVAYFPEMVNICNEAIVGSQVFIETGKDIACVIGAYLFGKFLGGFGRKDNVSYRANNFRDNRSFKGRSWWND